MRKATFLALAAFFLMTACGFAGPFSDVPQGHYGYDVLRQAQDMGLITIDISKPITRYEMATAVAEIISKQDMILAQAPKKVIKKAPAKKKVVPRKPEEPKVVEPVKPEPKVEKVDPRKFVTKGDLQEALADYATKEDAKKAASDAASAATKDLVKKGDIANLATKDEVAANKKQIDEFKASLAKLSKDLKEELAAIGVRLSDLEKGQAELKDKVSDLEKKIPNVGGEIRVRGHYTKIADGKASFGNYQQRTRLTLTKAVGDNAVATVQFRNLKSEEQMDTPGGDDTTLELANICADTKLGKITVGYQYFKLGAYGLLVHDNDNSTGAALWEKSLGKLKLAGLYAVLDATSSKNKSRIIAGRAALPIGKGELGATMRFKGPDVGKDLKSGMAVDISAGPITAEYATYKEDVTGAEAQTMLVAGVKLGKRISLSGVNKDKEYGLGYSVTSVSQEDLPLILLGDYDDPAKVDKDETIQGIGVNLNLGAIEVEVAKLMEDEKKGAKFGNTIAKGGLGARVTYTTDLAEKVQLQIRAEQIGTKVGKDTTYGSIGSRIVRGQLLVKF